jgi:hypothetical protein
MHILKKQDVSIYYWLTELFNDAPFIKVVDGFPTEDLSLPTIALENEFIEARVFELGNRQRIHPRIFFIDIFAADKSQRDEYAYRIVDALEENIPVYDYDEGFPNDVAPAKIGTLEVDEITIKIIKVIPGLTEKLFYRSVVQFSAVYQSI